MKPETDLITDDEWLLRRVHSTYFKSPKYPYISPEAFKPSTGPKARHPDLTGISLYREACLSNPEAILATIAEGKHCDYGIIKLRVEFIKSFNLTVACEPDSLILGHVVIPELDSKRYEDKLTKPNIKFIMLKLAEEASKPANIVREPKIRQ